MSRYIDADKLKRRFELISLIEWNFHAPTSWANAFGEAADMIDDEPTADVAEVKRARWKDLKTVYRCSVCGYNMGWTPNYCPHCGAKMDEVSNENTEP